MKNVFPKIKADCSVCGTPTNGKYVRNGKYYCAEDYEKNSPEELAGNRQNEIKRKEAKKIFG